MSGAGAPETSGANFADLKVTIVAAQWHEDVMNGLLAGATRFCAEVNVAPVVIRVPGTFELPVAVAHAARSADAVVALGVVIRGGTPHFEYVCGAATDGLTRASLDSGVPVGFGVLTCDTDEQARDRAGFEDSAEDKGREATHAALATAATLKELADATRGTGLGFGQ